MLNTSYEAFQFGHVVFLWPKSLHIEHLFFLVENDSPTPRCLLYVIFLGLLGSTYGGGISLSVISKGQSKNLQLAPGEFPDNMPLGIFSLNNMERSTSKSHFQNHHHVGIESLPLHVDMVFCPNKKFYKYKFFFVDPQ